MSCRTDGITRVSGSDLLAVARRSASRWRIAGATARFRGDPESAEGAIRAVAAAGAALTGVVRGFRAAQVQRSGRGEVTGPGGVEAFGKAALIAYRDNRDLVERAVRDLAAAAVLIGGLRRDLPSRIAVSTLGRASGAEDTC